MLSVVTALFFTLFASLVFHLFPNNCNRLRLWWVAAFSFAIVFAYYPIAAVFASFCALLSWAIVQMAGQNRWFRKYGPFLILLPLIAFSFSPNYVQTDPFSQTLVQFGMSFYVFRLYLAMRTAINAGKPVGLEEFFVIALFFPIFAAGPICAQEAFKQSKFLQRPIISNYLLGLLRIGIGITALYLATTYLTMLSDQLAVSKKNGMISWEQMGMVSTYAFMLLKFLNLYANFAGYTEVAIGLGLFFGFQIPENFRYPFLATNIQNFWQRWHLSLSRFITTQIYLPIMLSIRKPRLSIFIAFVLVGLWHMINLQYLVWGIGHGLALVLYMTISKSPTYCKFVGKLNTMVHTAISWLITMTVVSFLSMFANEPSTTQSLKFVAALLGLN